MGGDELVGTMALVEDEKQTECQQKSATGGEGSEMQSCSDVGNERKCAWKKPKRTVKWVSGVRKVWGTRKESCDNVAKEVIRAVGKMASRFSGRKWVS